MLGSLYFKAGASSKQQVLIERVKKGERNYFTGTLAVIFR